MTMVWLVMTAWGEDEPALDSVWSSNALAEGRVEWLAADSGDDYTAARFHVFVYERVLDDPSLIKPSN